jgi:hypothetical protein
MGKKKKQTVVQTADPKSQKYIDATRGYGDQAANVAMQGPAGGGSWFTGPLQQTPAEMAQPFMNPYQDQVIAGVRGEFDHLRAKAGMGTDQAATQAGAFGGSRHGVATGTRMGELDRAQASQIGGLLYQGHQNSMTQGMQFAEHQRQLQQQQLQDPLFRQQTALNFRNLGMGPVGSSTTQTTPSNPMGGAMSGAALGTAIMPGIGTAVGAGLGLLGSWF